MSLFATTSRRSYPNAYIRIFLSALADETDARSMSHERRSYIYETAKHAAQLVTDHNHCIPRKFLEAVDLAFEMRENDVLAHEILELRTENDFAPELARKLLQQLHSDSLGDRSAIARRATQ